MTHDIYKKIVIIGAGGQLGTALQEVFKEHTLLTPSLEEFNLTHLEQCITYLEHTAPTLVINAAAGTNVDGCETDRETALLVNATTPGALAQWCKNTGVAFVTYSTDYVFDGEREEGYTEDASPSPKSVYGESKALMEQLCEGTYIIRTSALFGAGNNFVKAIANAAKAGKPLTVVNDQISCITYAPDLAAHTKYILDNNLPPQIYHVTNTGVVSRYDVAREIVYSLGLHNEVHPTSTEEYYRNTTIPIAPRPHFSALINTKLPPLRLGREAVREYLKTI